MDFDQYVAARYGRLIEHAVLLGCEEGEAGAYVDRVLLEHRKQIGRAEDPDPLVHEALERAISGTPDRRSRTGPLVALGLVTVAVLVGVALTYRPPPEPMPSLFAMDGTEAQQLLEQKGYDVVLRPARACEPLGLVLGSEPPVGRPVRDGATVTVRTAVPSGTFCQAHYAARSDAWAFLAFALGGPAPAFARTVHVVVDGREGTPLDHVAAVDLERWGEVMTRVADTARTVAPTLTGMPRLSALSAQPPPSWCGVPRPEGTGSRQALRIEIDPRAEDDGPGCPLTIDLYRSSDREIDGVVVYTAKELGENVAEAAGPPVGGQARD
jgi:hypothetical protein